MAENAQDVFDELWNRYELACSNLELEIGQDCLRGPRGLSGYDMTIRTRFAKAVSQEKRSKSTPLTEKQKKCPYCHEDKDWIADNDVIMHYGTDSNGLPILDINDHGHWITTDAIYCQWCGRKLDGWYRFGEK